MSGLTDLEICKKIAEIEGVVIEHIHGTDIFVIDNEKGVNTRYDEWMLYNPLTDDGLCFRLMVKYKLSLVAPEGEQADWDCIISDVLTTGKNPNKLICLAIIKTQ